MNKIICIFLYNLIKFMQLYLRYSFYIEIGKYNKDY